MTYEWKDAEHENFYYFNTTNGRIVGQVHNVAHTKIWLSKVFTQVHIEELYLGRYISCDTAKTAIENFILIEEKTLLEQ
jgi:hypothetical protein